MRILPAAALSCLVIALAGCGKPAEQAPAAPDTLQKISREKAITLGYRESSVPFSYYDNRKQVIGYSYDLAMKVVDEVRVQLDATYGNRSNGSENWFSIGLRLLSPRFLP